MYFDSVDLTSLIILKLHFPDYQGRIRAFSKKDAYTTVSYGTSFFSYYQSKTKAFQ